MFPFSRQQKTAGHESAHALDDRGIVSACPSCGQKNRQVIHQLGQASRCGKCATSLAPAATPVHVDSEEDFEALLRGSALPVLVDFWAPWCGPCRMVAPELDKVAAAEAGRLVVAKVNTEDLPEIGDRFAIRSIPTMAVYARGKEAARSSGARPADAIREFAWQALGKAGIKAGE